MTPRQFHALLMGVFLVAGFARDVAAEPPAPDYEECRLEAIFPAGGQVGQMVAVEFFGIRGGLADAKGIVIDGPPGIAVRDVTNLKPNVVRATLDIAADAAPGRRGRPARPRCRRLPYGRTGPGRVARPASRET